MTDKKTIKIPEKTYFDVHVECLLPATLTYRVLAESAEQAAGLIKHVSPNSVKHKLIGRKELKMKIYDAGTTLLRFTMNLFK